MKKILLFLILTFPVFAYSQTAQDTVNVTPFDSLTAVSRSTIDTSDQVLIYDSQTNSFAFRGTIGELLRVIDTSFVATQYYVDDNEVTLLDLLAAADYTADGGDTYDFKVINADQLVLNANQTIQFSSDNSNVSLLATLGTLRMQATSYRMINVDRASATESDSLIGLLGITSLNDSVELFQFSDLMFNFIGDSVLLDTSYIAVREYVDKRDSTVQIYLVGALNGDQIVSTAINAIHASNPRIKTYEVLCFNNTTDSILTVTIPDLSDSSYVFNQVKVNVKYIKNFNGGSDGLEILIENDSSFYGPEGYVSTDTLTAGQYASFQGFVSGGGPDRLIFQKKPFGGSGASSGGIWEEENSNTLASDNTTDNYHAGNIGIGDFSGTTIGATIHAYDVTNVRLRLSDSAANDTLAQAYVEYYRGYATSKLGQIGYTDNTDLDLHIENHLTGGGLEFRTDNVEKMKLFADGQLRLNYYGDSIYTGTATKYLAVDADGFVIEADAGGASITSFTPDGTEDTSGDEGDLAYDDDYIYVKTSAGWKRGALSTFISSTFINVDTMPDLLLWLVADSLILANNDPVSTWTDESGNGNDYAQSGSARPKYKTNVVNGKAVVDFDGTDDYLRISDLDVTSDSVEVFVVYYTDTYDSSGGFALIGGSADSSSYNLGVSGSGGGNGTHFITRHSTGNSIARDGTAATTGEWLIANGNYNQVQTELIINGTSEGTNAQTAALLNPAQPEFIGAYFGGVGPLIVGPFDGKIAEIIVFTAYLSTARRTQVKNYLAGKYGITVN